MSPTPPVGARIHIDVESTPGENISLTSSTSLAARLRSARDARESSTTTALASVPRSLRVESVADANHDETDAMERRMNANPNEEKFEGYIAATRAATGCDRDEAATAVALAVYRRERRRIGTVEYDDEDVVKRATTLARGTRELGRMGFSDVDGVASGALAACDGDVERAVEACLAVR